MSRDIRTPTSVTCIGIYTVRIFDEQEYAENIRRYYGNDATTGTFTKCGTPSTFAKKKKCRYDWASWREPMIKEQETA